MKIVAVVRTLNEEAVIGKFLTAYQSIADEIIVADGGSTDRTVSIAKSYPKTSVFGFYERKHLGDGYWENPAAAHFNFLLDIATSRGADWVLHDDCDCVPNSRHLLTNARDILTNTDKLAVYATRIYLWGDRHFPRMAQPIKRGEWTPSAWGWNIAKRPIRFLDVPESNSYAWEPMETQDDILNLMPPYCLLHDYMYRREEKVKFFRDSGRQANAQHPLESGYELVPREEWMV